jgi:hypothetical protein
MTRQLREPPAQAEFDRVAIPTPAVAAPRPNVRLGNPAYPSQFFANLASRLTPISGEFACVYLAASKETAVAEVWGDRFWQHRAAKAGIYTIARGIAANAAFMAVASFPSLNLCDLTHADVRLAVGLESGTFYSPDLAVPQTWAERIARHPGLFDGIVYRSRITDEKCLVLWLRARGRALHKELSFSMAGPFYDAAEAFVVAQKCGVRLAFGR